MKALIFNSGLGSRLGELTAKKPKAMVRLSNGETIFERQLRVLHACGIDEFVVTTGPFSEQLRAAARRLEDRGCSFSFVANEVFDQTNYIYSMYLARDLLREGDFLMLHGDLVFDARYAQKVIDSEIPSLGSINKSLSRPEKDFKARIFGGQISEVSTGIFDEDCYAFQPFYKLSQESMGIWLDAVEGFVREDNVKVYAENAANSVLSAMNVRPFSYEGHFVEEVDTPEDLERVSAAIRLYDFEQQPVFAVSGRGVDLVSGSAEGRLCEASCAGDVFRAVLGRKPLVVAGSHFDSFPIKADLEAVFSRYERFGGFSSNPTYEEVLAGLAMFRSTGCDSIVSVGGGSAMDVAKCIKAFAAMDGNGLDGSFVEQPVPYSLVPHVAVPTTAGTGSESTSFAVCYVGGRKTSVSQDCLLPDAVVLDPWNLAGLPEYQKKCTMLDALCQAIESYWAARSTERSRAYSVQAIPAIMANWRPYLDGDSDAAKAIMMAANAAGKAINLTTTTAAHAMSYKITSLYGIPHGHAVAMCLPPVWKYLLRSAAGEVAKSLEDISRLITGANGASDQGVLAFEKMMYELDLARQFKGGEGDLKILVSSVNTERLSNFPADLSAADLEEIYKSIMA